MKSIRTTVIYRCANSLGIKWSERKANPTHEPILRLRKCRMLECHNSLSNIPTMTSKSTGKVKWQYAQSCADAFINNSFWEWESCTPGSIVTRLQAGRPANQGCIAGRGTNISPHFGVQNGSGSHSHISSGHCGPSSLGVESSGRAHVHPVPKAKKEWSHTSNASTFSWLSVQSNTGKKFICWCVRMFVLW